MKNLKTFASLAAFASLVAPFVVSADCTTSLLLKRDENPQAVTGQKTLTIKRPMRVLVYGVGDVVRRYVGPALDSVKEKYGGDNVKEAFVDESKYWQGTEREKDMRARIVTLQERGGIYLDKSALNGEAFKKAVSEFAPNCVFIETPDTAHIANMRELIGIFGEKLPRVFFDKPFGANLKEVREFTELLRQNPTLKERFAGIDHFKAMIKPKFLELAEKFLGGDPELVHFWLVENHLKSDAKYKAPLATQDQPDAIRREGRQNALAKGLGLDLFTTHGLAKMGYFGDLQTADLRSLMAAQYNNSPIAAETFGELEFEFVSHHGKKIKGIGTYGKGILGVQALGADYNDETFALELRRGGRRLVGNFSTGFIDLYNPGLPPQRITDSQYIETKPYNQIMENTFRAIAGDEAEAMTHLVSISDAFMGIEWGDFIYSQVSQRVSKGDFDSYPVLIGNLPPTVEQIKAYLHTRTDGGFVWKKP